MARSSGEARRRNKILSSNFETFISGNCFEGFNAVYSYVYRSGLYLELNNRVGVSSLYRLKKRV